LIHRKMTEQNKSVLAFNLSFMFEKKAFLTDMFIQLLDWLKEGRLVIPPLVLIPIEQVAEAHRLIESGNSIGRIHASSVYIFNDSYFEHHCLNLLFPKARLCSPHSSTRSLQNRTRERC